MEREGEAADPRSHHSHSHPRPREARRVAQNATVKVRVGKEWVGRLISLREFDKADAALQEIARITPLAEQETVAVWMLQVASLKASLAEDGTMQADAARQAYVQTLQQRRDHVAACRDMTAVSRWRAIENLIHAV